MTEVRRLLAASTLALFGAIPAAAQTGPIANLIPDLFDRTIVLATTGHQAHFVDSSQALVEAGLLLNDSIVSQLGSLPISSSAGGFTYTFDPALGVMTRNSESFGPIFTERAETIGKGKWNVGMSSSRRQYDMLGALDLDEGGIVQSFTHLDTNHDGTTVATVYEGDLILAQANLDLTQDATIFSASWGVSDRVDLAIAVPYVSVDLNAELETSIVRLATEGYEDPPAHTFEGGHDEAHYRAAGTASGVGDLLLRAKFALLRKEGRGLALGLDVRLPTGNEEELLGTGATAAKLQLLGSSSFGRLSLHVNASYTASDLTDAVSATLADEAAFGLAADVALHDRVTLVGEVLWRTLLDAPQIEASETAHLYRRHDSTQITSTTRPVLTSNTQNLDLATGVVGLKWNLFGQVLLTTNVLVSLTDDGLHDEDLVPMVGIDYSF